MYEQTTWFQVGQRKQGLGFKLEHDIWTISGWTSSTARIHLKDTMLTCLGSLDYLNPNNLDILVSLDIRNTVSAAYYINRKIKYWEFI